jgi:hypothetical protein
MPSSGKLIILLKKYLKNSLEPFYRTINSDNCICDTVYIELVFFAKADVAQK